MPFIWMQSELLCTFRRVLTLRLDPSNFVLRILQISSAQSLGGGERHLADLANGLVVRGHEVYVALRPRSSVDSRAEERVKAKRYYSSAAKFARRKKRSRSLTLREQEQHSDRARPHGPRLSVGCLCRPTNPRSRLIITRMFCSS